MLDTKSFLAGIVLGVILGILLGIILEANFFFLIAMFEFINEFKPRRHVATRVFLDSVFQDADSIMS